MTSMAQRMHSDYPASLHRVYAIAATLHNVHWTKQPEPATQPFNPALHST